MFRKTALRLAGFYLGVLVVISLFFSVVVYELSVQELERGLRLPDRVLSQFSVDNLPLSMQEWQDAREQQYIDAKSRVVARLLLTNIIIIASGGVLSYILALRTLRPIEQAHASLERFTADASHELRTPIAAMQSETEVTLMNPRLSLSAAKLQLKSNLEELAKLTDLTSGLLRLARMDSSGMQKEQMSAAVIVDEAIERVQATASEKDVRIVRRLEKELGVYGDKQSLAEALVIILDNAIKYSTKQSTITIRTAKTQKYTVISVKDSGIGIKPEDKLHIFERFYRADAARSRQGSHGYGIGLAIAKDIIEIHGGRITVQSKYGKGSTFFLHIPAKA